MFVVSLSFLCISPPFHYFPKTAKAPIKVVKDKVITVCILCKDLQYKVKAYKKFIVISLTNL